MAGTIQNAGDEVGNLHALRLGEALEVRSRAFVEVDQAVGKPAADGDLVHVDVGRVEETVLLRHGDDRERVGEPFRSDGGSFQRVERDVDLGPAAGAHLLADIEHRRLVALALADHHSAVYGEAVERRSHRIDRDLIGGPLVPAAHQPGCRERRRLGHPDRLERKVPVHLRGGFGHDPTPFARQLTSDSIRIMRGG